MGWLSGWKYRKRIDITGQAGAGTDYQVPVDIKLFTALPANAAAAQVTPTYDGSGQAIHPSVVYFPAGWNGYSYWMAMTPFPNGNDAFEKPSILASNDGVNWVVPPGLVNPIDLVPSLNIFSDPDLFYDSDSDQLWCYYRDQFNGGNCVYWRRTSADGVNWSARLQVYAGLELESISPSFLKVGATYYLWMVNHSTHVVKLYDSPDGVNWNFVSNCVFYDGFPTGKVIWHPEVYYSATYGYIMLADVCNSGVSGPGSRLCFARSADRVNWYLMKSYLLDVGGVGAWDEGVIYRATMILDGTTVRIWYSAMDNSAAYALGAWHIGYTSTTLDANTSTIFNLIKSQVTLNDIRFTSNNGATLLSHWFEEQGSNLIVPVKDYIQARFWVKVAADLSVNQSIYVYYRNTLAASASDIKNTSLWGQGDDFNDNALDPALWQTVLAVGGGLAEANQRLEETLPPGASAGVVSLGIHTMENFSIEVHAFSHLTLGDVDLLICPTNVTLSNPWAEQNAYRIMLYGSGAQCYAQRKRGGAVADLYSGAWVSRLNKIKLTMPGAAGTTINFYEGDTLRANEVWNILGGTDCYIYLVGWTGAGNIVNFQDSFWSRKLIAAPEPSVALYGGEELPPSSGGNLPNRLKAAGVI